MAESYSDDQFLRRENCLQVAAELEDDRAFVQLPFRPQLFWHETLLRPRRRRLPPGWEQNSGVVRGRSFLVVLEDLEELLELVPPLLLVVLVELSVEDGEVGQLETAEIGLRARLVPLQLSLVELLVRHDDRQTHNSLASR